MSAPYPQLKSKLIPVLTLSHERVLNSDLHGALQPSPANPINHIKAKHKYFILSHCPRRTGRANLSQLAPARLISLISELRLNALLTRQLHVSAMFLLIVRLISAVSPQLLFVFFRFCCFSHASLRFLPPSRSLRSLTMVAESEDNQEV